MIETIKVGDKVELYPNAPQWRQGRPRVGVVTGLSARGWYVIDNYRDYSGMCLGDLKLVSEPYKVEEWNID